MKRILVGAIALTMAASSAALAQPYGYDRYNNERRGDYRHDSGRHQGWGQDRGRGHRWQRGQRMGYNDWNASRRLSRDEYRRHRLRAPPRGYEWRERDGQYILAAVATGLIASIILNNN